MEIQEVITANRAVIAQAKSLNVRAGEVVFIILSYDEMMTRFTTSLRGARRVSEIQDFDAVRLPGLDSDLVKMVTDDNPDTVEILGREFAVEYRNHYDPRIEIRFEDDWADKWQDIPETLTLPGGREISIKSVTDGHGYWIEAENPIELKGKIKDALNRKQWEKWEDKPEMAAVDPEDDQSVSFVTTVYGQCVVTGDDLKAYGTVEVCQYWSSDPIEWRPVWYRSESEARKIFDRSVAKLIETKAVIAEKRAKEARAQAEAEANADTERLEQERAERTRAEAARQEREVEAQRLKAVARGKERVSNLNQRRKTLDWDLTEVYADGFESEEGFVSFDDENGLQAAETKIANEERRLKDLHDREVNEDDLTALLAHFNKK
jgi:hypothetical protein